MDELPIAAQLATAILGGGILAADRSHQARLQEEAELMNQEERVLEERQMEQTISGFDGRNKVAMALLLPAVAAAADAAWELEKAAMGEPIPMPAARAGARWARRGAQTAGAAAPAAAGAASAAKPFLSGMTKAKLLGGAGLIGAGYLGYKGLQAARDYMAVPSGSHAGPPLQHSVNEYGYPQY